MSKTALDFLIEKMTDFLRVGLTDSGWDEFDKIVNEAKEKEKQQIVDAYWGGLNGFMGTYNEEKGVLEQVDPIGGAEDYYNQTYNQ